MSKLSNRSLAAILVGWALCAAAQGSDSLYQGFEDPPARYRPMPIWYWNGKIESEEAKRQIDEYAKQGAQGALVYPAIGLRTPFLSEEWWRVWAEILPYARQKNFKLGWMPDFNHPQGDARDVWMDPPEQSRVMTGHPEYRLKRLMLVRREFSGPGRARFERLPNPVIAVAARKTGLDSVDATSLIDLSGNIRESAFEADLGEGRWLISFYHPVLDEGTKGRTRVDQLIPEATQRYIDLTLGEFHRRFPEHVGTTLTSAMLDHEGSYGGPIVWTPKFFDTFHALKGYDFKKYLPLLIYDGGDITPKIRNDYFDVVTDMFVNNFWKPIADWGKQHGVAVSGQSWGDWLQLDPAYGGDFLKMQRAMAMPFTEEEESSGRLHYRSPRQFKEPGSIAHFEGRPFACECLLVQGVRSFVSPQKMRMGTNVIAGWGVNLWNQNTSYDEMNGEWPPQMGRSQPHWKFFHHYSDLVRRVSYMNDQGRHVADVVLFRPISSVVTCSDDVFDPAKGSRRAGLAEEAGESGSDAPPARSQCGDFGRQVEKDYGDLMLRLSHGQRDYDIFDDHYLERAVIEKGAFRIAEETFHVMVLPRMNVIRRASLSKIREFYENGGAVVAYGTLPSGSTEKGWNDPEIASAVRAIFGISPGEERDTENRNSEGGRSFFIQNDIVKVIETIGRVRQADFQVLSGSSENLTYSHRVKDGRDYYWVASDTDQPRKALVSLSANGKPELWDATDGARRETAYWIKDGRVVVPLEFAPWDAIYIVLSPTDDAPKIAIAHTNLARYAVRSGKLTGRIPASEPNVFAEGDIDGKPFRVARANPDVVEPQKLSPEGWRFQPLAERVRVNYAREMTAPEGDGTNLGFEKPAYNDGNWPTTYLAAERLTIRDWNLIGPFPNLDHQGFNTAYPPEAQVDLDGGYAGLDGQTLKWRPWRTTVPEINLGEALSISRKPGVAYALTYVHSPSDQQVQAILVAFNAKLFVNGQLVFQHHPMPRYFEYRDGFGFKTGVPLKRGWNQVLVKIESDSGSPIFYLRLCGANGLPVRGLHAASRPADTELQRPPKNIERWYRMMAPPGTRAMLVRPGDGIRGVFLNGKALAVVGGRAEFPPLDWNQPNMIAVRMSGDEELQDSAEFEPGPAEYRLGSWTGTGLSYFSGEATYEKTIDLDPKLRGQRIELDLGEVGVTAEVWVNGKKAGERVWAPFRFDVTNYLLPGANNLKIAVTNSDANRRASASEERYQERTRPPVGGATVYLDAIGLNGLIGPVQLVPYRDVTLEITERNVTTSAN